MGNKSSIPVLSQEAVADDVACAANEFAEAYIRAVLDQSISQLALEKAGSAFMRPSALPECVHALRWPYKNRCPPAPAEPLARSWLMKLGEVNVAWKRRWVVVGGASDGYSCLYFDKEPAAVMNPSGSAGVQQVGSGETGWSAPAPVKARPKGSISLACYRVRFTLPGDLERASGQSSPTASGPQGVAGAAQAPSSRRRGSITAAAPSSRSLLQPSPACVEDSWIGLALEPVDPRRRTWLLRFDNGGQDREGKAAEGAVGGGSRSLAHGGTDSEFGGGIGGGDESATRAREAREKARDALRYACLHAPPPLTLSTALSWLDESRASNESAREKDVFLAAYTSARWRLGLAGAGGGGGQVDRPSAREQLAALCAGTVRTRSLSAAYDDAERARAVAHAICSDSPSATVALQAWECRDAEGFATGLLESIPGHGGEGGVSGAACSDGDRDRVDELDGLISRPSALAADTAWAVLTTRAELLRDALPAVLEAHGERVLTLREALDARFMLVCAEALDALAERAVQPVLPVLIAVFLPIVTAAASDACAAVSARLQLCLARGLHQAELKALYSECQVSCSSGSVLARALSRLRSVTRPHPSAEYRVPMQPQARGQGEGEDVLSTGGMMYTLHPVTLWEIEMAAEAALRSVATSAVYSLVSALEGASRGSRVADPEVELRGVLASMQKDMVTAGRVVMCRVAAACSAYRLQQGLASDARIAAGIVAAKGDEGGETSAAASRACGRLAAFRVFQPLAGEPSPDADPLAPTLVPEVEGGLRIAGVWKVQPEKGRAALAAVLAPLQQPQPQPEGGVVDACLTALFWHGQEAACLAAERAALRAADKAFQRASGKASTAALPR